MQLEKTLDDMRLWITGNFAFYSVPLAHLPFRFDDKIPTAGTDGQAIYFNPSFATSLTVPELRFVVLHEIMHVVLLHLWRRGQRDLAVWNISLDVMVNGMLLEMLANRSSKDAHWTAVLKMPQDGIQDSQLFRLGTGEKVYERLMQCASKPKGKAFDVHDWGRPMPGSGKGKVGDSVERMAEQKWKVITAQAVQVAQRSPHKGELSGTFATTIQNLLQPRIRWTRYLASVATETLQDDYDWTEPDEDFLQQGIIIPELYSEGCQVAFALDTSGSIPDVDLRDGASEAFGLLASRGVTGVLLMGCDAQIHYERMHRKSDPLPEKWTGRGGTDFCPVFERIKQQYPKIKLLVYFTDGYGTFPKQRPGMRTIWVTKTDNKDFPFGDVVRYDRDNGGED